MHRAEVALGKQNQKGAINKKKSYNLAKRKTKTKKNQPTTRFKQLTSVFHNHVSFLLTETNKRAGFCSLEIF